MPRSAVGVAQSVSTVLCWYVLLLLLVYDSGGGGEVLWCRLVCHPSNEVTADARLVCIGLYSR